MDGYVSPAIPKDGQYAVDSTLAKFPFPPGWEATGVINDIPGSKSNWDGEATPDTAKRPAMQRGVSRQVVQKTQFDVKQKLADAMDTARAAELALREILSSWRAAKYVPSEYTISLHCRLTILTGNTSTTTHCHSTSTPCHSTFPP